ncbi:hypothetical protein B0T10DRAFT_544093 [Thelonectria olida]|uniref:Heterokaryon incompatibility domain-containing protein n=1 Tax=Thelonectria olida TaxID=1576542 RepID=A0A9P9AUZ6_9HYPO|nr:hypothetical protein B0T10DRAFT_544093 [Thelonectria olida]
MYGLSTSMSVAFGLPPLRFRSREHGPSGNHFKAGSWSTFGSEVGSSQDLETIRSWISLCEAGHKHCCSANSPTDAFFPAKIIDVQDIPLGAVHLWDREYVQSQTRIDQTDAVTGKPLPSYPSYWALSHRWGCRNILKLSSSTEHQFRQGIAIEQLSPTFRDAAHLVHRLGYRYLWIDSICTFQDSNIDWQRKPTRWLMSTATHIAIYPPSECLESTCCTTDPGGSNLRLGMVSPSQPTSTGFKSSRLNLAKVKAEAASGRHPRLSDYEHHQFRGVIVTLYLNCDLTVESDKFSSTFTEQSSHQCQRLLSDFLASASYRTLLTAIRLGYYDLQNWIPNACCTMARTVEEAFCIYGQGEKQFIR